MNVYRKLCLYLKYKKKKFLFLGHGADYKQCHSKFINTKNISIGNYSKILDYAYFDGTGGISIGDCTIIAPKCTILTVNHNYDEGRIDFLPFDNLNIKKSVFIDSYCWIGRDVMILPGVKIGKACVVAARSVVTKDIPPYSVVGGNPAKIIKKRKKEHIERLIKERKCWSNKHMNPHPIKKFIEI